MQHPSATQCSQSSVSLESLHFRRSPINRISRFAFVEYESRRDADDAYHEMHNKRIGRDDMLKIEVRPPY